MISLKGAAVLGGGLAVAGLAYRQAYYQLGRDFQPARARAYLDSIQPGPRSSGADTHPAELPNIVIILTDDLGYGDLASPAIDTPHLKRMAADVVSLSSFCATAAECSPSRAGMLTGRYYFKNVRSFLKFSYKEVNSFCSYVIMFQVIR